jgi:hypothetical protein
VAEPAQQGGGGLLRGAVAGEPEAGGLVAEHDVVGDGQARHEVELLVDGGDPGGVGGLREANDTTSPAKLTSPASGRCAPASTLIRVDFPAPFWPSRQCTSPATTSRSTPSRARTPGNSLTIPRIDSSGVSGMSTSVGAERMGRWAP